MSDLPARVRARFSRELPARSPLSTVETPPPDEEPQPQPQPSRRRNVWSLRSPGRHRRTSARAPETMERADDGVDGEEAALEKHGGADLLGARSSQAGNDRQSWSRSTSSPQSRSTRDSHDLSRGEVIQRNSNYSNHHSSHGKSNSSNHSSNHGTSDNPTSPSNAQSPERYRDTQTVLEEYEAEQERLHDTTSPLSSSRLSSTSKSQHPGITRKQSIVPQQQTELIRSLLGSPDPTSPSGTESAPRTVYNEPTAIQGMGSRKIWVKRPGGSATLVTILEGHLVDDVRDMILKKYANTLGRSFDSPDVTLRVVPRENRQERTLGPEEPIFQVLDSYFPGGQTVDEALVIDVPLRRTPRPSPQPIQRYYQEEERRPPEAASEYFPPMPVPSVPSPHIPASHAMSVLTTGHVPNLPSPGAGRRAHHRDRPRIARQHTASPVISGQPPLPQHPGIPVVAPHAGYQAYSGPSDIPAPSSAPAAPPLPSPPSPQQDGLSQIQQAAPSPRVSSPRPPNRPKKGKSNLDHPSFPQGMLNGAVPPINVLIVEDNIINLKLLEAFMKRLKVRSQNAMNGREAVTKWRTGGFHLVLMDIQLPIMNGLDATKEIRRLERLNSIGVFTSSSGSAAPPEIIASEAEGDDKLQNTNLFRSPVIIVALTASSLQSDRHEALAAGCNDFLTKPVNFVWLERKVMEWGCMQALIDYDGWRQWKDFSQDSSIRDDDSKDSKAKGSIASGSSGGKKKKHRPSAEPSPNASTSHLPAREANEPVGLGLDNIDNTEDPDPLTNHTELR